MNLIEQETRPQTEYRIVRHRKSKLALRQVICPIGPGIAYIPLTKGLFALIDVEDANRAGQFNWYAATKRGDRTFYARRKYEGLTILLHRFIYGDAENLIDHKSGNGLDCRKANLRPASHTQNNWNASKSLANTTGYKGVGKAGEKWVARISHHKKRISLGIFDDPVLAYRAYCQAAIEKRGEFVNLGDRHA